MFDVTKEVPSLELCRKLMELGYPQERGGFQWYREAPWERFRLIYEPVVYARMGGEYIKAPTVRELGEQISDFATEAHDEGGFWVGNVNIEGEPSFVANSEADARAKMLIWLVENGYMKFEEVKEEK